MVCNQHLNDVARDDEAMIRAYEEYPIYVKLLTLVSSTSLLQLVNNLQQAGKIRNLQQVCGVSGCVVIANLLKQSLI